MVAAFDSAEDAADISELADLVEERGTPGIDASATTAAFSASLYARRRSVRVMTSIRPIS